MAPQYTSQVALSSAIVGAITIAGYYYYKKLRQNRIPKIWEPVGTVSELYMYPLKSGKRHETKNAKCTEYGLQSKDVPYFRDRCLVIYKEAVSEIITARTYPKIILIETNAVGNESFSLNAPGMTSLRVKVPFISNSGDNFVLWHGEQIFSIDCGDEAARWISNYVLGESAGLRLGYHDGQHRRDIEKYHQPYTKIFPKLKNFASGMYSDLATALLITKASINDLEKRIPDANVTIHNFRPNIVVSGKEIQPYTEDTWEWIKVGDVIFQNVMLCSRCAMTTVNSETGEFLKNYEPITTMRKYRTGLRMGSGPESPNLGIYMGMKQGGDIQIGDTVFIGKC